jgi:hypothetical protein
MSTSRLKITLVFFIFGNIRKLEPSFINTRHFHFQRTNMNNLNSRVELLANIAIVFVAVVLVGVITYKFVLNGNQSVNEEELKVGTSFVLPEVNWAANKRTLVLVLQKDCHFCKESSGFYKTLVAKEKII